MSIEKDFSDNNQEIRIRNHPNDSVPTTVTMSNDAAGSVASSETEKNDYTSDEKVTTKGGEVTDHEHRMYTLDTPTTYFTICNMRTKTSDLSYFFIFLYILDLKSDDPEFGVDKPSAALHEDEETDGGYGWLVILGTFCIQVTAFGVASCW